MLSFNEFVGYCGLFTVFVNVVCELILIFNRSYLECDIISSEHSKKRRPFLLKDLVWIGSILLYGGLLLLILRENNQRNISNIPFGRLSVFILVEIWLSIRLLACFYFILGYTINYIDKNSFLIRFCSILPRVLEVLFMTPIFFGSFINRYHGENTKISTLSIESIMLPLSMFTNAIWSTWWYREKVFLDDGKVSKHIVAGYFFNVESGYEFGKKRIDRNNVMFFWLNPILNIGYNRQLCIADLPVLPIPLRTTYSLNTFLLALKRYRALDNSVAMKLHSISFSNNNMSKNIYEVKSRSIEDDILLDWMKFRDNQSIDESIWEFIYIIYNIHGNKFIKAGFIKFCCCLVSFSGPLLLGRMVNYIQDYAGRTDTISFGLTLVLLLSLSFVISAILNSCYSVRCIVMATKVNGLLSRLIFHRSILLPNYAWFDDLELSPSQVTTLIQVDVGRVANIFQSIHDLWTLPLEVIIAFILLYLQVKEAFFAGVVLIILIVPLNMLIAKRIGIATQGMMTQKDLRIQILSEAIQSMKSIKLMSFESIVLKLARSFRRKEMKYLTVRKYLDAVCVFLWASMPVLVPFATFSTTVLLGIELTASKVFTTVALLNMLIFPMNAFPWVINGFIEALVSLRRIIYLCSSVTDKRLDVNNNSRLNNKQTKDDKLSSGVSTELNLGFDLNLISVASVSNNQTSLNSKSQTSEILRYDIEETHSLSFTDQPPNSSVPLQSTGMGNILLELKDVIWIREKRNMTADSNLERQSVISIKRVMHAIYNRVYSALARRTGNNPLSVDSDDEHEHETDHGVVCTNDSSSTGDNSNQVKLAERFILGPFTLTAKRSDSIAIIGTIASGKSSFLLGILKEIYRKSGVVYFPKTEENMNKNDEYKSDFKPEISYCPQQPVLHANVTIQDNILMGHAFNKQRYDRVLTGCCLMEDLKTFVNGDKTEIKPGASNISGGQRLRIGIARALYSPTDIVLMDDPFSALDIHTATTVRDTVLQQSRQFQRLIIITSHYIHLLQDFSLIIRIDEGKEICRGSYSQVVESSNTLTSKTKSFLSLSSLSEMTNVSPMTSTGNADEDSVNNKDLDDISDKTADIGVDTAGHAINPVKSSEQVRVHNSCSVNAAVDDKNEEDSDVYRLEAMKHGKISRHVFQQYLKAGGVLLGSLMLFAMTLMQITVNGMAYWWAFWINHPQITTRSFFIISATIVAINIVCTFFRSFLFAHCTLVAAKKLHEFLLQAILCSSIDFFEVTAIGRIINRIGQDVFIIDDQLPFMLNIVMAQLFSLFGSLIVIVYTDPLVLVVLIGVCIAYYRLQRFYRYSSRELRRLESVYKSPMYSHLHDSIMNSICIRSMNRLQYFESLFEASLNSSLQVSRIVNLAGQWLNIRLQLLGATVATTLALSSVLCATFSILPVSASLLGLSLSYSLTLVGNLNGLIGSLAETEKDMISVERVLEYVNELPNEFLSINASSLSTNSKGNDTLEDNKDDEVTVDFRGNPLSRMQQDKTANKLYDPLLSDSSEMPQKSVISSCLSCCRSSSYEKIAMSDRVNDHSLQSIESRGKSINATVLVPRHYQYWPQTGDVVINSVTMYYHSAAVLANPRTISSSSSPSLSSMVDADRSTSTDVTTTYSRVYSSGISPCYDRNSQSNTAALKNISLLIKSGSRVAIIGRSGSGKSSLLRALLHINEYSGSIHIAGEEITSIPKQVLRSRISVVPQDPLIFSATLRFNLDPYSLYSDIELIEMLDLCGLRLTLMSQIYEGKPLITDESAGLSDDDSDFSSEDDEVGLRLEIINISRDIPVMDGIIDRYGGSYDYTPYITRHGSQDYGSVRNNIAINSASVLSSNTMKNDLTCDIEGLSSNASSSRSNSIIIANKSRNNAFNATNKSKSMSSLAKPQDKTITPSPSSNDKTNQMSAFSITEDSDMSAESLYNQSIASTTRELHVNMSLLNMKIQDNGQSLSFGQKQLICLARTLLKPSKLILVDEATSSIDEETEKLVYRVLKAKAIEYKATVLCVCHKVEAAFELCDTVVEMRDGQVIHQYHVKNSQSI